MIMEEKTLQLPGGAELNYVERVGTDPMLTPLVLVHGYLDSHRSFSRVLERVAAPGRRLVALTLRGWGDSSKTGSYTIDSYAEDIVDALTTLNISKAVLGGHSMGTLIGTAVAARHPARVEKLVLMGGASK